jgi:hypothetical protein
MALYPILHIGYRIGISKLVEIGHGSLKDIVQPKKRGV